MYMYVCIRYVLCKDKGKDKDKDKDEDKGKDECI